MADLPPEMEGIAEKLAEMQELGKRMSEARDVAQLEPLQVRFQQLAQELTARVREIESRFAAQLPHRIELDGEQVEEVLRETGETVGFVEASGPLPREEVTRLALERARKAAAERAVRKSKR